MRKVVLRILAVILFAVVHAAVFLVDPQNGEHLTWTASFPSVPFLVATLCTFLGIVSGSFFREVRSKPGPVNPVAELLRVFRTGTFWSAICIAPFVIAATYTAIGAHPTDGAAFLLAYQNGFFWETVLKRLGA